MKCSKGEKIFMEYKEIFVKIVRDEDVTLSFDSIELKDIYLSRSTTSDLEEFFNSIFEYILLNKVMLRFVLKDDNKDFFHNVSTDIISQLNSEIKQSEANFEKIVGYLTE